MRVPRKRLAELMKFVAEREGARLAEVDLAVVGRDEIASLNRSYLHRAGPTDILSFDLSDSSASGICVQLVVWGDVALEQARARGLSPQHELMLYVVHGLLHVMGYDDTTVRGAARMHARQDELLDEFAQGRRH